MIRELFNRHRRKLKRLAIAIVVVGVLLWLLPIGLRLGAVHWLQSQGLTAEIEDIDLNLFTGVLAVTDARGETDRGDGFRIGHLRANLDYWPLFSKHIYLSAIEWRDTRIDLRREEAGDITIAGLPLAGEPPTEEEPGEPDDAQPWGFGVARAAIDTVTLRYIEPGFTRSVTLASTQTRDVTTWDTRTPLNLDADVSIGDARIRIEGELKPFGRHVTGDLRVRIDEFGLTLVAPMVENAGVAEIAGTVGSDLRIGLNYRADTGLSVQGDGALELREIRLAAPGIDIRRGGLAWQGDIEARLLQSEGSDGIDADGSLTVDGLDLQVPETLALTQESLRWEGLAEIALRATGPAIASDGTLQLTGTDVTLADGSLTLTQDEAAWQGTASATVDESGASAETDGQLTVAGLDVDAKTAGVALSQTSLSWQGTATYAPGEPATVHSDGELSLGGTRVRLAEANLAVAGERLVWQGKAGLDADGAANEGALPLTMDGTLTGETLVVNDLRREREMARVGAIRADAIAARGLGDIRLGTLRVSDIDTFQRPADAPKTGERPYTFRLASLEAGNIGLRDTSRLRVDTVRTSGLGGYLLRREDGGLEFLDWLAKVEQRTEPETTQQPDAEPAADGDAFAFALGDVSLGGDSEIVLADRTVAPDFQMIADGIEASLQSLDSRKPDQASPIRLKTGIGRYGDVRIEGTAKPLQPKPSLSLNGTIEALNLSPLSGYVAAAIERRISQGILDAKLDVDVDRGAIEGEADLTLAKFRLGGVVGDTGAVERGLGLPMDKALDLLRDGDGNVSLTLPLGGDLSNPTFSIASVVQKAVLKGIQVAVLSYYSPLGVLTVGKKLVDLATALSFKPVPFQPGEAELDGDDRAYLDKMAELLNDRPRAKFVICGRAVPADRQALGLPPSEDNPDPEPEALRAARDRLLALASERSELVGDYLVGRGIDSGRLVLCNPELGEGGDTEPRTTISF